MNTEQKTEEVIRQLVNMAGDHGFAVVQANSMDLLLYQLLTGSAPIGATNYQDSRIEIMAELADDRSFLVQVLAHEVGHAVLGHGCPGGAAGLTVDPITAETEADRWAINYLTAEGLDTSALADHERESHDPDNVSGQWYEQQAKHLGFTD